MDVRNLNATTDAGKQGQQGRFRMDRGCKRLQFSSGPLQGVNGQVLDGPRFGLNMNGGTLDSLTCSLKCP